MICKHKLYSIIRYAEKHDGPWNDDCSCGPEYDNPVPDDVDKIVSRFNMPSITKAPTFGQEGQWQIDNNIVFNIQKWLVENGHGDELYQDEHIDDIVTAMCILGYAKFKGD